MEEKHKVKAQRLESPNFQAFGLCQILSTQNGSSSAPSSLNVGGKSATGFLGVL